MNEDKVIKFNLLETDQFYETITQITSFRKLNL